jgi:hypothetical protein
METPVLPLGFLFQKFKRHYTEPETGANTSDNSVYIPPPEKAGHYITLVTPFMDRPLNGVYIVILSYLFQCSPRVVATDWAIYPRFPPTARVQNI